MEIDKQMIIGGASDYVMVPVDHLLVVAVHEVDLDTAQAPTFRIVEMLFYKLNSC